MTAGRQSAECRHSTLALTHSISVSHSTNIDRPCHPSLDLSVRTAFSAIAWDLVTMILLVIRTMLLLSRFHIRSIMQLTIFIFCSFDSFKVWWSLSFSVVHFISFHSISFHFIPFHLYIYKGRELLVGHVPADCSAVCGPIWLKLWWMVG